MMIKRIACLYRVSTKSQMSSDDDIPMQKKACSDFIKKQKTWVLEKEYIEKGVSGYHRSADERDALIQLKKDAVADKFDILLVFMFDRLGRREDETPFVVEWLVQQNIEVWSVKEGQQRFDDHADKLINYIRYWQSSGESENTSMRVAEKHNQLVMDGKFRGGVAPYGYTLEYSGEYNRKGYERKKLVIYEPEASIVRRIFELSCDINMGSYRVAKLLNSEGALTRTGKNWTVPSIARLLRNPVYKGDYVAGKVRAKRGKKVATPKESWVHSRKPVELLMIIEPSAWEKANENIDSRVAKAKSIGVASDKSDFLLTGMVYCGYCRVKLHPRTSTIKRTLKGTGEVAAYKSRYYCCPKRLRLGECDGQHQYGIKKIEAIVLDEIHSYLENIKAIDISLLVAIQKAKQEKKQAQAIKPIDKKAATLRKEITRLEDEILKCLAGESSFTEKRLSEAVSDKSNALTTLEQEQALMQADVDDVVGRMDELIAFKKSVVSWKKEFAKADAEKQKELIGMIVDSIHISRESADISFKYNLYDIENIYGGKIVRHEGAPPACPLGSSCCGGFPEFGGGGGSCTCGRGGGACGGACTCGGRGRGGMGGWNWLGSVTVIPCEAIASFTHNAI